MIQKHQHTTVFVLLALQVLSSIIAAVILYMINFEPAVVQALFIAIPFLSTILFLYWKYHWISLAYIDIIFITAIVAFIFISPNQDKTISIILFLPASLAVLTLPAFWTLLIAGLTYALILVRLEPNISTPYDNIDQIMAYVVSIMCLYAGRLLIEHNQQATRQALSEAQRSQTELLATTQQIETQNAILADNNAQQTALLDSVTAIELPLISIGPRIILVPLIGALNSKRIRRINERLLVFIRDNAIEHIVLDMSGITQLSQGSIKYIQRLTKSIRLVGALVTLSGIEPTVAGQLAAEKVEFSHVTIVRSAYDILGLTDMR